MRVKSTTRLTTSLVEMSVDGQINHSIVGGGGRKMCPAQLKWLLLLLLLLPAPLNSVTSFNNTG